MRFLLVVKQKKNVEAFFDTMRGLVDRGHFVTLAVQERDEKRDERLSAALDSARFEVVRCPSARADDWAGVASLLRRLRDCVHYLRPPMRPAGKLRARIVERLRQDLSFQAAPAAMAEQLEQIPGDQVQRLEAVLSLAEEGLPSDPLFDEFLTRHRPDLLLVSPLIHFGSAQADLVVSARRLGVPVGMLLYSWDNLSTKGSIHRWPDRMFVWNEQQKREAKALHGFPPDRVTVIGAPRFDAFFALRPRMTRSEFLEPLGLNPLRRTLLYVCSSRFVSESEIGFLTRWLGALRASASDQLRECNVLVRPHPDIRLLPADARMTRHRWPTQPDLTARTLRPFGDDRTVVLQTDYGAPDGLYESIAHSDAVVGLNTTAELEAGIVGRPVFTLIADERDADGQSSTLHFHYLTKAHGGFVSTAASVHDHFAQIDAALREPADAVPIRAFIESFLRPLGVDRPVAPLLADALERAAAAADAPADLLAGPQVPSHIQSPDGPGSGSGGPGVSADVDRAVLPLGDGGSYSLRVYATPIADRLASDGRVPVDPFTAAWLERDVQLGDVVYDVGAGIGEYVLVAAKRRGAIVVAFEPAYAAYANLCENVLLNGSEALVVPIPLALSGRDGLAELKYQIGHPGEPEYLVRDDIDWRVKHRGRNRPYLQPACLACLDTVAERFRLPQPNHVRVSPLAALDGVLAGAMATLALPSLKTLCLCATSGEEPKISDRVGPQGFTQTARAADADVVRLVFSRVTA